MQQFPIEILMDFKLVSNIAHYRPFISWTTRKIIALTQFVQFSWDMGTRSCLNSNIWLQCQTVFKFWQKWIKWSKTGKYLKHKIKGNNKTEFVVASKHLDGQIKEDKMDRTCSIHGKAKYEYNISGWQTGNQLEHSGTDRRIILQLVLNK